MLVECTDGDAHEGAEGQAAVELGDDDAGEQPLEERLVGLGPRLRRRCGATARVSSRCVLLLNAASLSAILVVNKR